MNKAFYVLLLATVLLFTSCYAKVVVLQEAPKTEPEVKVIEVEKTPTPVASSNNMKTGLSFVTSTTGSKDGKAQADATLVAVAVDENGVIQDCIIDMVQAPVKFDEKGQLTSDTTASLLSKNELGDRYGMRKASSISKEWNEQMASLAKYVVGKTANEVKGISIKDGKPEDVDLASSVTLYIGGYLNAIVEAVNNAEFRGAGVGDKLSLVTTGSISSSKSATQDKNGVAQADITAGVVTTKDGVITSCYIDMVQAKVNFDATGKIVSELSADVETKNELKERYGMSKVSSIGKDWYQQIEAFSSYVTGKTLAEVNSIAVNEKTAPTDADLSSSVTMAIGGYRALLNKVEALKTTATMKTGLSFVTSTTGSKDGKAQADATLVAVAVDENGVIQDCIIDMVQAPVKFDEKGQLTSDTTASLLSKNELGDRYGMRKASSISKEWNEQMASLAKYVVGKTANEVKGISIKDGKPEDVDLASSVTLYIGGYLNAIVEAVNNAEFRGAGVGDKLSLVTTGSISSSKSATQDKNGVAQADITAGVVTTKDGVITSCYIDMVQAKVNFDATGKIVSELSADVETKNELKERYGMSKVSSIGKDWYQQIEAFSSYVTGKTLAEVNSIAVNEKTAPTDADLSSSVTMAIGGYRALLNKVN